MKVAEVSKKTRGKTLMVRARHEKSDREGDEKRALDMEVQGRRRRRPKARWKDCIAADMREKGLDTNMTNDRLTWKQLIKNATLDKDRLLELTKKNSNKLLPNVVVISLSLSFFLSKSKSKSKYIADQHISDLIHSGVLSFFSHILYYIL